MPRITEMWAFIATENGPEDEGIPAASGYLYGQNFMMPLVGADRARIESIREKAQEIASMSGKPLRLARFTMREDIEVIEPRAPEPPAKE